MKEYLGVVVITLLVFTASLSVAQPTLAVGESRTFTIPAKNFLTDCNIRLVSGGTYQFTASGTWYDAKIRTNPDGFTSPDVVMAALESTRRKRNENWFCLIGEMNIYSIDNFTFRIGKARTITIPEGKSGKFYCWPNDAHAAYGNNSGAIALVIRRIR